MTFGPPDFYVNRESTPLSTAFSAFGRHRLARPPPNANDQFSILTDAEPAPWRPPGVTSGGSRNPNFVDPVSRAQSPTRPGCAPAARTSTAARTTAHAVSPSQPPLRRQRRCVAKVRVLTSQRSGWALRRLPRPDRFDASAVGRNGVAIRPVRPANSHFCWVQRTSCCAGRATSECCHTFSPSGRAFRRAPRPDRFDVSALGRNGGVIRPAWPEYGHFHWVRHTNIFIQQPLTPLSLSPPSLPRR